MKASILISSHERLPLLRRTLYGIATRRPSIPFEVILADDGSTDDILAELRKYSSVFAWTFVRVDPSAFEEATGIRRFFNNPCLTNNVAFKHADPESEFIFQQGNEVIPWGPCYDELIAERVNSAYFLVMSTTYDLPASVLDGLDAYGANLTPKMVQHCQQWPLQSMSYRSDVTNYISLASRQLWEAIGGYDERYFGGISSEDSDFVRRARALPAFEQVISGALSLHQFHNGKTKYYSPPPRVITKERWDEGVEANHALFFADWDGKPMNPQRWAWGTLGVQEVIKNT